MVCQLQVVFVTCVSSLLSDKDKHACRISGTTGLKPGKVAYPKLNGQKIFMAGWLDQSYWPDGKIFFTINLCKSFFRLND